MMSWLLHLPLDSHNRLDLFQVLTLTTECVNTDLLEVPGGDALLEELRLISVYILSRMVSGSYLVNLSECKTHWLG